jgi:RHS repeat-associated protein
VNTYYYHSDHLGSAQLVTDYRGNEYEHIEYTPYGELFLERIKDGVEKLPFRFTGKELDPETGLYYYGARYLDPKTSLWLSSDPALKDYIPLAPRNDEARKHNQNLPGMGGVFNLVNLHLYHYAGNNPVKYTDPDGREDKNPWKKIANGLGLTAKGTLQTAAGVSAMTMCGIATMALALDDGTIIGGLNDPLMILTGSGTLIAGSYGLDGAKKASIGLLEVIEGVTQISNDLFKQIKGQPRSIERIERDRSGSRNDRHAHGKNDEWAINEDGTMHDNNHGRVPKDAADYLRKRGFNIPDDRFPIQQKGGIND